MSKFSTVIAINFSATTFLLTPATTATSVPLLDKCHILVIRLCPSNLRFTSPSVTSSSLSCLSLCHSIRLVQSFLPTCKFYLHLW
ncbi:hypothetical protein PF008_g31911 [Phytophthora fragariae]|uniref:RxLR effector protein n=1 Tax=Phytophthora fragariae TaxID=53985 RepID=A0A6G0Q1A0_9STRA|nr:hypothetical protein PF008_g31911 [Phytophthora fragariae]